MNKPKVRKVYLKILALLTCPLLLSGCSVECNIPKKHVHKYEGSNRHGIVSIYLQSERKAKRVTYYDPHISDFIYERKDEHREITNDDEELYHALEKGKLFDGIENWDYLYNVMKNHRDYIEYQYEATDGESWWNEWSTKKPKYDFTGKVRITHYRFCGHKLIYKDGEWIDERSPFVDDIRDIIDEYPYFQLDPYTKVRKEYKIDKKKLKDIKLEDLDEFIQPDLSNKDWKGKTK